MCIRDRENTRSFLADRGVRIRGENTEWLNAVFRRKRSGLAADGKLSLLGNAVGTNFFVQRGANFRLLRLP